MTSYKQGSPFTLKLEPTEGCTLACWFCGIQAIRDNGADRATEVHGTKSSPFRFMTLETLALITDGLAKLGWNPRWEIAGRGEPTMNPDLVQMVSIIRADLPLATIILTTNGAGLFQKIDRITALFKAGLNTLALDDYKHAAYLPKIREWIAAHCESPVYEYPQQKEGNPYRRTKPKDQRIIILRDISEGGGVRRITNQGDALHDAKTYPMDPCAKPFREMTFRWDGRMSLCCDDWPGHYKVGSIHDTTLLDLWHSPEMDAARRALLQGKRVFRPCLGCDVQTKRNGLLPDKMGKDRDAMPFLQEHLKIAKTAASGPVQTPKLGGTV
jgi:hypothetical protein